MSLVRKKFSKDLYDQNDTVAKELVLELVKEMNNEEGHVNPDQYGPDLVFKDYYGECEIKYNWRGKVFPFKTIQFPERKMKFLNLDKPTTFFMLNADRTYALIVSNHDLLHSPLAMVSNKYIKYGEHFFQVPISKAKLVKLTRKEVK